MTPSLPISNDSINALAAVAMERVFTTMLARKVELESIQSCQDSARNKPCLPLPTGEPLVVGTVGFIGSINGIMYIYMAESLAVELTCTILGLKRDELVDDFHEMINDAIGEMTNMIVGTFKNKMSEEGIECKMTIPSILRGSHFSIEPIDSAVRNIFLFKSEGLPIVIDLLLKPGD